MTNQPLRSMTGFAQMRRATPSGDLQVSLRAVNHRGLDLHFYLSQEFAPFEAALRGLLKERIGRGHVEIRISLNRGAAEGAPACNIDVLKRYVQGFETAARTLGLAYQPEINALLTLPGVMAANADAQPLGESFEAIVTGVMGECLTQFNAAREREGAALGKAILHELSAIEESAREIAPLREQAVGYLHNRLKERLAELLGGASLPESRLAEEAAILADRSDVQEELVRLEVHTKELRRIVEAGGAVGKPLDFLLQEMNRETNTTLSKSSGAGDATLRMTSLGLAVKANIERIREQALNLE